MGRYLIGVLALTLSAGGLGACGLGLRRRLLPDWTGAEARLAELFLAAAALAGILELLGTVRLFRLIPIVAACVLAGLVARAPRARDRERPPLDGRVVAALVGGGAVLALWLNPTLDSLAHGIRTLDTLWYHLPWAVSYAQTGQITSLRFTDVEYLTAFYPALAETVHGAGIVLLGHDTLSPLINLGWLCGCLLAGWCLLGAPGVLGVALALGTPMMDLSQAGSAANDVTGIFFLLCAAVFWRRDRLELCALAAGLAIATKLSLAAPALAVALAALVTAGFGGELRTLAGRRVEAWRIWLAALVLGGGYWYVRNLIAVGNPLPWVSLPHLATPTPALQDSTGFSVAHYLFSARFWSHYAVPALHAGLGSAWPAVLAAAILGPLAALTRPRTRALGVVALLALLAYLLTPESAAGPAGDPQGFAFNLRYAGPALTLCLLATAALDERVGWGLGALLAVTLWRGSLWGHGGVAALIAVAVIAAPIGLRALLGAGRRQRPSAAAAAAACLVLLTAGGYLVQRAYLRDRYRITHVSQMSYAWNLFREIHDSRVGVVGTYGGFFAYPLTGLDGSDRLTYLGRRGPAGSFAPITSCVAFQRAVRGLDYVVATPARDPWHPKTLSPSPEAGWLTGARIVLHHRGIFVFRLPGRFRPCG